MSKPVQLLLRAGVAFAFLYPPISALTTPFAWIGYFPPFLLDLPILDSMVLLHLFGALEVVIGLWLLSGWRIFWPSIAAAIFLAFIIVFNFAQMDVLFRDVSILLMALVLAIDAKGRPREPEQALS